jgi:hypothetical protein
MSLSALQKPVTVRSSISKASASSQPAPRVSGPYDLTAMDPVRLRNRRQSASKPA